MRDAIVFSVMTLLSITSWANDETLPTGAIKKGTLVNAQLMADAKIGVAAKVGTLGCTKPEKLEPYIVATPSGPIGQRQWKELWVVSGCGKTYPISMDFKESGSGAADWTIGK